MDDIGCPFPSNIIWWPIIYALMTILGVSILILFISMISPPGTLACLCPIKDYVIMSATSVVDESRDIPIPDDTFTLLTYVGSRNPAVYVNHSSTSNSTKFVFRSTNPSHPPETIVYTPTFTGNSPQAITGAFSASLYLSSSSTNIVVQFLISWSNDNGVTWHTITESQVRTTFPLPSYSTFSLPYAISFTKSQMSSAGNVILSSAIIVTRTFTSDVRYGVYDITISATEV